MKAQVALEYLYTYGWVMVVLVIVIGALVGSGIFNPTAYGKDYCIGPTQIKCVSVFSSNDQKLYLTLQNDFGFDIKLESIRAIGDDGVETNANIPSPIWKNGQKQEFVFESINSLRPSSLNKLKLQVNYRVNGESPGIYSDEYKIISNVYTRTQKQ